MVNSLELNLDLSPEVARQLHRVVRAIHDGNCPSCGYLAPSQYFWHEDRHECPICHFTVTAEEARGAMLAFRPYMKANAETFEKWRNTRKEANGEDP